MMAASHHATRVSAVSATASAVTQLVDRFRAGDPDAAGRLYAEYGGVVRLAVRKRLPDRLRAEYDSIDFTQDVWASFCRLPAGRHEFATPADLGGFLARMAYFKVIDVCRKRLESKKADANREQAAGRTSDGGAVPLDGREATPSQVAIADERWAALAAALPAPHAAVLARLREGYTQAEVAAMAGVNERTVRRIVDRAREAIGDRP